MPQTASKPSLKRKAPTFKPPRPISKTSKATKPTTAPRRKSAPTTSKRGLPSIIADQASASDDDEENDDDDDDDEFPPSNIVPDASEEESDASMTSLTPANNSTQDPPPTIPPALLTRLLHHNFSTGSKMRIGKEANGVIGKYMETFVREVIARAAFERAESLEKEGGGADRVAGDFLEVEDLEKLAPQLLLDF